MSKIEIFLSRLQTYREEFFALEIMKDYATATEIMKIVSEQQRVCERIAKYVLKPDINTQELMIELFSNKGVMRK